MLPLAIRVPILHSEKTAEIAMAIVLFAICVKADASAVSRA
jgi:hypothetical protein